MGITNQRFGFKLVSVSLNQRLGFTKMTTSIKTIKNRKMTLNCSLLIITAAITPTIAPIRVGRIYGRPRSNFNLPFLWKIQLAMALFANTPTRLVPFARFPGRPMISVRIVRVMADPFPASVLINPAANPPRTAMA